MINSYMSRTKILICFVIQIKQWDLRQKKVVMNYESSINTVMSQTSVGLDYHENILYAGQFVDTELFQVTIGDSKSV